MKQKKICAIVLAGGKGSRMHSEIKKQYMTLVDKPLLVYSLLAFERSDVNEIIVVADSKEWEYIQTAIVKPYGISKVTVMAEGGKERYHSVYAGLKSCDDCDYVLIHDGARPLLSQNIITETIKEVKHSNACVVGVPVKDTIKRITHDGCTAETLDRDTLWQVQTPQAFSYELIRQAYEALMENEILQNGITDDAMVVEKMTSIKVKLVEGSYRNIKVTTPEDLLVAEAFLKA